MALGMSTAKRVFFIVVLVSIVASLVMIGEFYRTGAYAFRPLQQPRMSLGIRLYFADYISNQVQAIDGTVSACLAGGTVQTNSGRTDYTQSVQFGVPGEFNGGKLVFKQIKTPIETANAALSWQPDTPIMQYKINFQAGLQSELNQNNVLEDLDGRKLNLLGTQFTFMPNQNTYRGNTVSIRLMGGYGVIDLRDQCDAQFTEGGVQVNGETIDARLRIICSQVRNLIRIESIEYRPLATPATATTADLDVLPKHGVQEYLLYPQALLTPDLNIFLAQVGSGGATASPTPMGQGDITFDGTRRQYRGSFTLNRGGTYQIDLVRSSPFTWGSDSGNRAFVVSEGSWINVQDYFPLVSGTGLNDGSWIYMLNKIDTQNNIVYWRDMARGGTKQANFNAAGTGSMNIGGYDFDFQIDIPNNRMKVDMDNDGGFAGTPTLRTADRLGLKFGPGVGDIEIRVPRELRQEKAVDEVNKVRIIKSGNNLDLTVISPDMKDDISVEGREQGMSQFGLRFVLDTDRNPSELNIFTRGGMQAQPQVSVSSGGQVAGIVLFTCEQRALAAQQS